MQEAQIENICFWIRLLVVLQLGLLGLSYVSIRASFGGSVGDVCVVKGCVEMNMLCTGCTGVEYLKMVLTVL